MDRVYSGNPHEPPREKNKRQKPMIPSPPAHVTCESTQIPPHPQTHVPTEAHNQVNESPKSLEVFRTN